MNLSSEAYRRVSLRIKIREIWRKKDHRITKDGNSLGGQKAFCVMGQVKSDLSVGIVNRKEN